MLGDRWSLLIIRDMMLRGFRSYKEFLECYEGIATNILADRLRRLIAYGVIIVEPDPSDRRKLIYLLTPKGIDLAPVLTEMVLWAAAHEDTGNQPLIQQMRADKKQFLAGVRQRWATSHPTPAKTLSGGTKPAQLPRPASETAHSERKASSRSQRDTASRVPRGQPPDRQ